MQTKDILTISAGDALYPDDFMHLAQPPAAIYALGNTELMTHPLRLTIVGTRRMTSYGKQVTTELATTAASHGAVIISGLAYGVDITAHQAALNVGGKAIAVLPSGLSNIYPRRHTSIAQRILDSGGLLISEYESDVSPLPFQFVARNRLMAALCHTVLVTEAALGSGSFHTTDFAEEMSKNIIGVPGSIYNSQSQGVNNLIKSAGNPVISKEDLLLFLGINEKLMKPKYKAANRFEEGIVRLLDKTSLSTNELIERTEFSASSVNVHLTMLEIKGIIEPVNGIRWKLI